MENSQNYFEVNCNSKEKEKKNPHLEKYIHIKENKKE
jgi:hypothetical protein